MFCYTVANSLECIIRELLLWSNTSKEHPTFLLTVAELSNKELGKEMEEKLVELHDAFAAIERETREIYNRLRLHGPTYQLVGELRTVIRRFLAYDAEMIPTLEELQRQSKPGETVWQVLVEHITDEQRYMARLMSTLLYQL